MVEPLIEPLTVTLPFDGTTLHSPVCADGVPRYQLTNSIVDVIRLSVAVCGSALSSFQVKLLLDLEVEEIIIAFDKQFKELGDKEHTGWVKKLKDINKKYSQYVKVSYMFDKENLLDYKDSPIDKGPETFMTLFDKRISL